MKLSKKPAAKQQKNNSNYITFASGWDKDNCISCSSDYERNAKANKGQGYKVFVVPVDETGEPSGDPMEVNNFALVPSGADKGKFPGAPDHRVFFGVE